ncbi:hypothetical protein QCA50_000042 [Cerrena zonata]|uniref:Protein PBN1 n=1 Tax=Cerrena zonata TaxID=2478898 RepID=A0AAW0GPJ7_9APHY
MTTTSQCSFTSSVNPTKGYHTAYTTEYSGDFVEGCSLHLAYTLPPDVFVDPYELRYDIDTFKLQPLPNLELPVKVASYNTSILTIQLDTSVSTSNDGRTPAVKIPIHARYGEPSPPSDIAIQIRVVLPYYTTNRTAWLLVLSQTQISTR